ncbi:hypothetical protein ABPG75_006296 [Micractinium tetrahymenae]
MAHDLAPAASGSLAYVDEEALLGFKIWVAELELLVGNARGRAKPDQAQCFQLLQKLVVTLDRCERPEVREYQRRCEEAVVDILLKGAPPPVRRLICQVLAKLYAVGDQLPLYSRVSSLQLFLGTKEAFSKDTLEDIRLGALECMAVLYYAQGRFLSIGVQETVVVAAKYCTAKHLGERTTQAALGVLAAAVEGVGGGHRHAQAVQADVFRCVERLLGQRELSVETRLACASVLRALGACGGAFLWASSLAGFEAVKALCLAGLEDGAHAVRAAFAQALGTIAVAATSDAARDSVRALEKRPKYAAAQDKALADVPTACLTTPFVEAASYSNRASCTALAQAWVTYLAACRGGMEEQAFVELALRVLEMLGAACLAAGSYQEASIVPGEGELGMGTGSGERPHAQACVLYVLRVGVIEQLGESGQRLLLDKLAGVLGAPLGQFTPVGVVTLEAMTLLLEVLGEVSAEKRAELEPAIGAKVAGPHACLRLQAAAAVAALAVAEPSSAARLVSASLANLHAALDKLVEATASAPPDRSRPGVPGTPRGVGSVKLKPDMNAVHGWALSGAALVAASTRLPLGVPASLLGSVLAYATRLITTPQSQQGVVACLEREAGYILLGALCATLPAELLETRPAELLQLFEPALGAEAATELDRRYCSNVSSLDHVVAMELWWRSAALQALLACISGPVAAASRVQQPALQRHAAALLKPTLDVLTAHAALQEPARGKGGPAGMFAGAAALMQLRLLEAYAALPSPAAYADEQEALTKLCMRAVRSAAGGALGQMLQSALRRWLNPGDALLGPWQMGRDPLERAMYSFEGVVGGPAVHPWQAGSRVGIGYAMQEDDVEGPTAASSGAQEQGAGPTGAVTVSPYPQPRALGAALLEAQLGLVGKILAAVAPVNQAAILDALLAVAQCGTGPPGPQRRKDRVEPSKRQAAAMAAGAAALASAAALAAGGRAALAGAGELAPRVRQLADEVLEESAGSVALQRAAADLYAFAAQLCSDAGATQLLRALCKDMAETASLPRRAALALAVGSCARAVGGLSLQAVLPVATETLVAVAAASDRSISVWVMHAMLLLANSAGLAFVPHLKHLLGLAQGMLLSEEAYCLPGLLPAAGRLANAAVALLGPDYTFGSSAYLTCKSIINDMRALEEGGGSHRRTDDAVSAALETVLYAQMLVLFAPQAVPAKSHLPVLVSTLLSRQPRLRKAAADTLRHLAERDARAVLAERIETALFAALDSETDPAIASQIKATLSTLLAAGAAAEPSRWLALCSEVVMAAAPGSTAAAEQQGAAGQEGREHNSDESDDEGAVAATAPTPRPASPAPAVSTSPSGAPGKPSTALLLSPRLRTRLFAAQLLLRIPALVTAADPRHADLAAAQAAAKAGQGSDWLVLRVQQLVDLAFRMASGQLEALRPRGVRLMHAVLACFGDSPDPVVEGARLMELHQAQVVSTLRASLAVDAAPSLSAAGASLAAAFLEKGLDGGEAAVLQRLMGLLVAPLAQWGGAEQDQLYAEWVGVRARVALLEAHAHCAVLAASAADDSATARVVRQAQSPHLQLLLDGWLGLLQDYVAVCTQPPEVHAGYRLRLCQPAGGPAGARPAEGEEAGAEAAAAAGPTPAAVLAAVQPALERAWAAALDAATSVLAEQPVAAAAAGEAGSPGSAAQEQHSVLLDISHLALSRAAEAAAACWQAGHPVPALPAELAELLSMLAATLAALKRLTAPQFVAAGWLSAELSAELAGLLLHLLEYTLLPLSASGAGAGTAAAAAAAPSQVAALAVAAAAVLRQLPASPGVQQQVVAAARAVLRLAGGNTLGDASSATALGDALAAVGQQLHAAAGSQAGFVPCLHQALELGLEAVCSSQRQQELAAAVSFLADVADAACQQQQQQQQSAGPASDSEDLPPADDVLAAAVQALVQHARHCASSNGSAAAAGSKGQQLEAAVSSMLAVGGALGPLPATSSSQVASVAGSQGVAPTPPAAPAPPEAAPAAAAASPADEEDEWSDDPFGDGAGNGGATAPQAAQQPAADAAEAAAGGEEADTAPAAADAAAAAAEVAGADEDEWDEDPFEEGSAVPATAQQVQAPAATAAFESAAGPAAAEAAEKASPMAEDEDEWGDDPFNSSSAPLPPAEPALSTSSSAAEAGASLAALSLSDAAGSTGAGGSSAAAAARQSVLEVLRELVGSSSSSAVQQLTLAALRTHLQAQQQRAAEQQQRTWALACAASALPGAAARVHALMGGSAALGNDADIQVVAEALKAGLLAVNLAGESAPSAQAALLRLLVPVLVEVAAPSSAAPTPLLADMAVKLLTHMAASPTAAAAFRGVAAELPAAAKQRLAGALQAAAAGAAAGSGASTARPAPVAASSGPMQRATVKLNFAAFKK